MLEPIAQKHKNALHPYKNIQTKGYKKVKEACKTSHNFILYACK